MFAFFVQQSTEQRTSHTQRGTGVICMRRISNKKKTSILWLNFIRLIRIEFYEFETIFISLVLFKCFWIWKCLCFEFLMMNFGAVCFATHKQHGWNEVELRMNAER